MKLQKILFFYFFILILYSIWSFALTEPNLVLSSHPFYWSFQQWMWGVDKHIVALLYGTLLTCLFSVYWLITRQEIKWTNVTSFKKVIFLFCIISLPLLFSYNALSHDVFNYIFNARMVLKYGANPHVQTALNFSQDEWVRFMHNIHTPAPYFYGWTVISFIPYLLGIGKFITTWLSFRLWSLLGLLLLIVVQLLLIKSLKLGKSAIQSVYIFFLNPLVLVELVSNAHNDAWMMWPALAAFLAMSRLKSARNKGISIAISCVFLFLSASMKYATLLLFPIWMYGVIREFHFSDKLKEIFSKMTNTLDMYYFDFASLSLFVLLFTQRSQQFHPWYLVWLLSFLPFLRSNIWRNGLLILSVSSLYRYLPWIWNGAFEFTSGILLWQKIITWTPFFFYVTYFVIHRGFLNYKRVFLTNN